MKPYKIIYPEKSIWQNTKLEVYVTEKKIIKIPLKFFSNCHNIPKNISEKIKIILI